MRLRFSDKPITVLTASLDPHRPPPTFDTYDAIWSSVIPAVGSSEVDVETGGLLRQRSGRDGNENRLILGISRCTRSPDTITGVVVPTRNTTCSTKTVRNMDSVSSV
jgi:hypothetical protein